MTSRPGRAGFTTCALLLMGVGTIRPSRSSARAAGGRFRSIGSIATRVFVPGCARGVRTAGSNGRGVGGLSIPRPSRGTTPSVEPPTAKCIRPRRNSAWCAARPSLVDLTGSSALFGVGRLVSSSGGGNADRWPEQTLSPRGRCGLRLATLWRFGLQVRSSVCR